MDDWRPDAVARYAHDMLDTRRPVLTPVISTRVLRRRLRGVAARDRRI
jgi:hypothetical protein